MCNEVADLLPTIAAQISSVPHDVEFLEGKLDTLQEALENDAAGIENARNTVKQDAADAKLAFRALDTLLLPLQYQMSVGDRWWSSSQQAQSFSKHSLRSALGPRHSLLSLPEDAEADASAESGGPSNLVEYFSKRADEMNQVVESYRKNLKDVEDHLHGVEANLHHQINELASAKSKEGQGYKRTSRVSELAATLADVETAILGVAGRLGTVKEEVQEMSLGPLGASGFGRPNGR
jgi:nucleoporin p58/p45